MGEPFSDRELLELFGAFLEEVEKTERDGSRFQELKSCIRENRGNFPTRFADGAEKLLQELELKK